MRETALVSLLMEVGFSHRVAVSYERVLDDCPRQGVGGDDLAGALLRYKAKCLEEAEAMIDLWKEVADNRARQLAGMGMMPDGWE